MAQCFRSSQRGFRLALMPNCVRVCIRCSLHSFFSSIFFVSLANFENRLDAIYKIFQHCFKLQAMANLSDTFHFTVCCCWCRPLQTYLMRLITHIRTHVYLQHRSQIEFHSVNKKRREEKKHCISLMFRISIKEYKAFKCIPVLCVCIVISQNGGHSNGNFIRRNHIFSSICYSKCHGFLHFYKAFCKKASHLQNANDKTHKTCAQLFSSLPSTESDFKVHLQNSVLVCKSVHERIALIL